MVLYVLTVVWLAGSVIVSWLPSASKVADVTCPRGSVTTVVLPYASYWYVVHPTAGGVHPGVTPAAVPAGSTLDVSRPVPLSYPYCVLSPAPSVLDVLFPYAS